MTEPTHVDVSIRGALEALLGEQLTLPKDLLEGEHICTECHGLGLRPATLPYGLKGGEGFPFGKVWLAQCHNCYFGVQKACPHCDKRKSVLPTDCCDAAKKDSQRRRVEKEEARVAKLPTVSYTEYLAEGNADVLYEPEHDCYIYDGNDLEPGNLYFACVTTRNWEHPEADDVIERMQERAEEQCEDGSEMLEISDAGRTALQGVLDEWAKNHVTLSDIYTVDRDRVVTVSWKDIGHDDTNEGDEEEAQATPQV